MLIYKNIFLKIINLYFKIILVIRIKIIVIKI